MGLSLGERLTTADTAPRYAKGAVRGDAAAAPGVRHGRVSDCQRLRRGPSPGAAAAAGTEGPGAAGLRGTDSRTTDSREVGSHEADSREAGAGTADSPGAGFRAARTEEVAR